MTARIAGYVTRKEWGALPPKDTTPLNGRRMKGTTVHNGGSGKLPASHSTCISRWQGYQLSHLRGDRGPQNDIAYNDGICGHGWVFEGRGMYLQGGANGTRTANREYFSVCIIGEGDANFTPEARDALEWVILRNRTQGNAGNEVKRHKDFAATACPNPKFSAFASSLDGKAIGATNLPRSPRLGDRGDDIATIQRLLIAHGYDLGPDGADGVFGEATDAAVRKFQTDKGLDVDGIVGPQTLAALQVTPTTEGDPPVRYVIPDADNPGRIKVVPPSTPGARPARDLDEADGNYLVAKIDALAAQLEATQDELNKILGYVSGV